MGKRKRSADHTVNQNDPPSSSDNIPRSSGTEVLSKEKSTHLVDSSELKPFSPGVDVSDNSVKLLNAHSSLPHHHYNVGRSVFLKRSRHHYSHQYSRRNSGNHGNASSSHGKGPPSRDERPSFKLAGQCNPEPGSHAETREKPSGRPDRLRFSSLIMDAASADGVKMICGICQKLLRRKPYFLGMGNSLASGEYSVIAVLVCGHVYHADCLEQRTPLEDTCDPPCPLCSGVVLQVESSGAQE
ncbi:Zinc finger, RING-type [Melia azedarach]|uniref:Zinc finger, RING-type n=1 Tax=Melia azedarach TaxID=155640 RepID=A0ACC1XCK1_MELAZ|nr:Zinc finger, RING-type [Melia azedarach]